MEWGLDHDRSEDVNMDDEADAQLQREFGASMRRECMALVEFCARRGGLDDDGS